MRSILNLVDKDKKRFKIIKSPTHERTESNWDNINADFYMYRVPPHIKGWNEIYAKIPNNHFLMPDNYFPHGIDFDIVLSQNRFGQYQLLSNIAKSLQIPLICIEHTLPLVSRGWTTEQFNQIRQMRGDVNVYIAETQAKSWEEPNPYIIRHCVNTEIFTARDNRNNHILTVANDYRGRDSVLGFTQYLKVTQGLPVLPIGDTPGLSKSADSTEHLAEIYGTSRIFLNTSTWSPIPTSLLEAMAAGCACVSSNNCEIPYYISHGLNGLLANSDEEMREYLELLLKDKDMANFLGQNARKTILEKCNKDNYTKRWDDLFNSVHKSQLRVKNEAQNS